MIRTALALVAALATGTAWGSTTPPDLPTSINETFTGLPDGPAPARIGTAPASNYSPYPSAAPVIRAGRLTTASPWWAGAGSYRIAHLAGSVSRVEATFSFTGWVVTGGVLCLSVQDQDIAHATPVPRSPLHLVLTPTAWDLGVNTEAQTAVDPVASGAFAAPLPADGHTLLHVAATVDRARRTVTLDLPDGSHRTVHDDAFGLPGSFVYVEPFKLPGPLTPFMSDALVQGWSADAG